MEMAGSGKGRAVLIAGPTASGKTRFAVERARRSGAAIVNADSMQVYDTLKILTARPGREELAAAPHRLFGHVPVSERYSVGKWLEDIEELLSGELSGVPEVIFVGGTGLYFEALTKGLSEIPPETDVEASAELRRTLAEMSAAEREALIAARDPQMAARLDTFDPQRVARALAVLEATGTSLAEWQDRAGGSLIEGWDTERVVLAPPRDVLRQRIADRFAAMMAAGAVAEVEGLLAMGLDPDLPAMKAIGVREIAAMLRSEIERDEAIRLAVNATRQYAKRQMTWFRKRMADWEWVPG